MGHPVAKINIFPLLPGRDPARPGGGGGCEGGGQVRVGAGGSDLFAADAGGVVLDRLLRAGRAGGRDVQGALQLPRGHRRRVLQPAEQRLQRRRVYTEIG